MAVFFSADDIFQIAIQMESNGVRFYTRAAERAVDPDSRELLLNLAAMEEKHEQIFEAMRVDLAKEEQKRSEPFTDPHGKNVSSLRLMAQGIVFDAKADPSGRLTGGESLEEVLEIAIGLEKDSVVYYTGMKDIVPEAMGREKIDGIIEEEMEHVVNLTDVLVSLKRSGGTQGEE
jgi:rubrerythrin